MLNPFSDLPWAHWYRIEMKLTDWLNVVVEQI